MGGIQRVKKAWPRWFGRWMVPALVALAGATAAWADEPPPTVTIDYPEQLPLDGLVDYVSRTLDVRILYGDELKSQQVVLRPGHLEIPRDRLLDLLQSVLRVRGLVLVAGELPGLYRITPAAEVQRLTDEIRTTAPEGEGAPSRVVTQVITTRSTDTKTLAARIGAFTSSGKASIIEVPERGLIIVTDYENVVARIMRLVDLIDAAAPERTTQIVPVEHADPAGLATQVNAILSAGAGGQSRGPDTVTLTPHVVPHGLVVEGPQALVEQAAELIGRLDVREDVTRPLRVYAPAHTSAERVKKLVEQVITGRTDSGGASMYVDEAFNRLYVTASPPVHDKIAELLASEDQVAPETARRTRIYRPRNRTAGEILDTLTHLLEEASVRSLSVASSAETASVPRTGPPGPNRPPVAPGPGQVPPVPPVVESSEPASVPLGRTIRRLEGPDYVLTEDEATNAILAVGSPEFHGQLAELIEQLDRRPAQVLIEMTLVAVSSNEALNLGVELEQLELGEPWDYLLFSSFGLSTVDAATGQRVLAPGVGVNGVLFAPDEVPLVIRALATHGRSRVISTPRVLVSDNTAATLRNVEEAPFTSVNASDTVATTSFGGFESAGTTLTATPHIAQGDHLTLVYNLTFSSFAGSAAGSTIPPPRTTNSFSGEVQVPDGYTVVVGGLEVENESDTVSEVPLLGRIPVLGALFQNSAASRSRSRIFAFIRPVILRDDEFADLKFLSAAALEKAEVENRDFPADRLMWMR